MDRRAAESEPVGGDDTGIVDFHTHPFLSGRNNICKYGALDPAKIPAYFQGMGITRVCGSVVGAEPVKRPSWPYIKSLNDEALALREQWGDFYLPGFHVHPKYAKESVREIERMAAAGVRLMGELVPYLHGWSYRSRAFSALLEAAGHFRMVVCFHSLGVSERTLDALALNHPGVRFVAAHPGGHYAFLEHLNRMERCENYYLDLSGTGLGRLGLLRFGIDRAGADRFLFGTDFPARDPYLYVSGVAGDPTLTREEKRKIFSLNFKRLFGS